MNLTLSFWWRAARPAGRAGAGGSCLLAVAPPARGRPDGRGPPAGRHRDFTPQHKSAEQVMAQWYGQ